jgi:hypothetical protein
MLGFMPQIYNPNHICQVHNPLIFNYFSTPVLRSPAEFAVLPAAPRFFLARALAE